MSCTTGRQNGKEAACVHKLRFIVKICLIVTPKKLAEFELKSRELGRIARKMEVEKRLRLGRIGGGGRGGYRAILHRVRTHV